MAEHSPDNQKLDATSDTGNAKEELLAATTALYEVNAMETDAARQSILSTPCLPKKALQPGSIREYYLLHVPQRGLIHNIDKPKAKGVAGYKNNSPHLATILQGLVRI